MAYAIHACNHIIKELGGTPDPVENLEQQPEPPKDPKTTTPESPKDPQSATPEHEDHVPEPRERFVG